MSICTVIYSIRRRKALKLLCCCTSLWLSSFEVSAQDAKHDTIWSRISVQNEMLLPNDTDSTLLFDLWPVSFDRLGVLLDSIVFNPSLL